MPSSKSNNELLAVQENTFIINGVKVSYAVLESNAVLISYTSLLKLLDVSANDLSSFTPTLFKNSKKKWDNGFYLKQIPEILLYLNDKPKVKEILQELSYSALRALTNEGDIIEEEPTFDQLLGALMRVPPPKK